MDNKPKEDKLMVITLDNSNPKSKIYWKEEDYNIFKKMCDDQICLLQKQKKKLNLIKKLWKYHNYD